MMNPRRLASLSAAVAATVLVARSAHAVDYSWSGNAAGNWTDAANWVPNTGTPAAADTATFNVAGVNTVESVYLNGNQAATSVTFANTSATTLAGGTAATPVNNQTLTLTAGLTVNSGAGAVTIGNATTSEVLTVANGNVTIANNSSNLLTFDVGAAATSTSLQGGAAVNALTFTGSGNINFLGSIKGGAGTMALTLNQTGTVEFIGSASSFAGGITVNSGILALKSSTALGSTASTLTINGGAIAAVSSARTIPAAVSLVFGGNATFGATGTPPSAGTDTYSNMVFSGPVDLGGVTRTLNFVSATTFSGAISNGGITKTGAGGLVLGNQTRHGNLYSGDTTISQGTFSTVGSFGTSENSSLILKNGTTFNANNGGSQDIGSLSDGGQANSTAIVTLGNVAADTLAIGWDNTNTTFSGKIRSNNPNANANVAAGGGIIKVGTGTLALTGLNEYNGSTRLNAGTLQINSVANAGIVFSNITPTGAQNTLTLPSVAGITVGMVFGNTNNIALGTTVTAVNTATNTITLSNNFIAAPVVSSVNIGTANSLGFSDNNAGRLIFDGGTLRYVGGAAATDRLFTLTTNGGTIDASGAANAALNLTGNTATGANAVALSATGTRTLTLAGSSTGANTFAPILGDNGGATSLVKSGTGTWVLTAANAHSGGTTVNAGTLVLANTASLGTGGLTVAGGTAQLQAGLGSVAIPALAVTAGALDVTNDTAVLTASDLDTTRGLLSTGYNGGPFNGTGIVSSTLASKPGAGLAYALASDLGITTVNGAAVPSTSVVVKTAYFGDINLDGKIDADDFALVDRNFARGTFASGSAAHWTDGDFNYDGVVSSADYALLDKSYAVQSGSLSPALLAEREAQFGEAYVTSLIASVPEPTTLGLLAAAFPLAARRRRAR